MICTSFPVVDDDLLEDNETFIVSLTAKDSAADFHTKDCIIAILDNDGVCELTYLPMLRYFDHVYFGLGVCMLPLVQNNMLCINFKLIQEL